MYEEYAVANKIEVGKTYLFPKNEFGHDGKPVTTLSENESTWLFKYPDKEFSHLVMGKVNMDKLIFEQKVLVKEFDKG